MPTYTGIIATFDIFVAMVNLCGIAAHFIDTITTLGLFTWLRSVIVVIWFIENHFR
ncbi:MAG: hypothetical protein AAF915_14445 [Cyanobacteria bacterium P01_D01_bin.50]